MGKHHSIQSEVDRQLHESGNINNIITFNGQGCSGKTTQSKQLVEAKSSSSTECYKRIHIYKLRSEFRDKIYEQLGRKDVCITYPEGNCQTLYAVEILGIPTLAWLTAYFHLKVKPLRNGASSVFKYF